MNRIDIIRIACWRTDPTYATSSADFATAVAAVVPPAAFTPIAFLPFLSATVDAGGSLAEAGKIYTYHGLLEDTKAALLAGVYADALVLLAIAGAVCAIAAPTQTALVAVVAGRAPAPQRLVDLIAGERNENNELSWPDDNGQQITVGTVTAADVDAALGR